MKLYLHIGTEKTGSSYLQHIAAYNRKKLLQENIWYPISTKNEKLMLKGDISPGNGQDIADYINKKEFQTLEKRIAELVEQAKSQNSNKLLISNELLLLALSSKEALKTFEDSARAAGIKQVKYLLILRNPVDQALSLYKHRAKSGTAPDIEYWPIAHYHYGEALLTFFEQAEKEKIELTCRKYTTQEKGLETLLFRDWLNCTGEYYPLNKQVNSSLNLSELLVIKEMRKQDEFIAGKLYDAFLELPKSEKAKDNEMEKYHRLILGNYLSQYKTTWIACNKKLPKNEHLEIPSEKDTPTETFINEKKTALSPKQISMLLSLFKKYNNNFFSVQRHIYKLKRIYSSKIKN